MANRKVYEWVVECIDEHGDIIDCLYWDEREFDKAQDSFFHLRRGGEWVNVDFGLCQHSFYEHPCGAIDQEDRQYFYIDESRFLPSREYGELPPKRFDKFDLASVSR